MTEFFIQDMTSLKKLGFDQVIADGAGDPGWILSAGLTDIEFPGCD